MPKPAVDVQVEFEQARQLLAAGDPAAAVRRAGRILQAGIRPIPSGLHLLRAQAFLSMKRDLHALHALSAELVVDPSNNTARELRTTLMKALHPAGGAAAASPSPPSPGERSWDTALHAEQVTSLELAAHRYTYRGVPMTKNCFDLALYPLLLNQLRPATIIEIGTYYGGSAIWFADMSRAFGFETRIWSVDVVPLHVLDDPRVTYLHGSGRELAKAFSPDFLQRMPRPLLVVEDADHEHETTLAVLHFFDAQLRSGEYMVVEDGMTAPGPKTALSEFFASRGDAYEVDPSYCDFFGYNTTWCLNGFLRRR